jgi:protein TonB
VVSLAASLSLHAALVALAFLLAPAPVPIAAHKRGEPLFVELPDIPEPAPPGNPAERSKVPQARSRGERSSRIAHAAPPPARETPRVVVPRAAEMPAAPPRVASAPNAEPSPPASTVRERAERAVPSPTPEPRTARPDSPVPAPPAAEKASPLPRSEPRPPRQEPLAATERPALAIPPEPRPEPRSESRVESSVPRPEPPVPEVVKEPPAVGRAPEPRVASTPRPPSETAVTPPAAAREAGASAPARSADGGDRLAALRPPQFRAGGLRDGRGGIEGEPIPLNTKDPRYNDYFDRLRRMIKDKWVYPREAAERNIGGQLMLEFGIAKDGQLRFIELRRSSGVVVLDDYAMNAVRLAQPFPRIPDEMSPAGIPVLAVFNYIIERDVGGLNNILR